jgi:hypothetical protein
MYEQSTKADALAKLRELLPAFAAAGLTHVVGEYDGSGDNGDFQDAYGYKGSDHKGSDPNDDDAGEKIDLDLLTSSDTPPPPDPYEAWKAAVAAGQTREGFERWAAYQYDKTSGTLTRAVTDAFETILGDVHGGWEINEGSIGKVILDVATGKVRIAHNERVESTEYSETELE